MRIGKESHSVYGDNTDNILF